MSDRGRAFPRLLLTGLLLTVLALGAATSRADELADQLARGERIRRELAVPGGAAREAHFEILQEGRTVGWSILRLEPREDGKGSTYRHELTMRMGEGAGIVATARAVLDPDFEVLELEVARTTSGPNGPTKSVRERALLGGDRMTLERTEDGTTTAQPASLPGHPCVAGLEFLLPLAAAKGREPFAFRELDPATGAVTPISFSVSETADGGVRLSASRDLENVDEYYVIDREGRLVEFGDPNAALLERRVTPERIAEIRAALAR